jgi:hypothetical protein
MAHAWQDQFLAQIRYVTLYRFHVLTPEIEDAVTIPGDKQRWLAEPGPFEERRQRPVAINIAIVVEPADESVAKRDRARSDWISVEEAAKIFVGQPGGSSGIVGVDISSARSIERIG